MKSPLSSRAALLALLLSAAASAPGLALAQPVASPPASMPGMGGIGQPLGSGALLRDLSPAGRAIVRQAVRTANADGTRQQIEATRARVLDILAADPLDVGALGRAMIEERTLAQGQQSRMHSAMLGAFQKLSVADRRAFVATAREVQARIEKRRAAMKATHSGQPAVQ